MADVVINPVLDKTRQQRDNLISKIDEYCERKKEELDGGDDFVDKLKKKIEKLVIDDEVLGIKDEMVEIGDILKNSSGVRDELAVEIESKKISLEVDKKLILENIDGVREVRKEDFAQKLIEESEKINVDLGDEKKIQVGELAKDISQVYSGTEDQKREVVEVHKDISTGQLVNSINEAQVVAGLLAKTPKELNKLRDKYKQIRSIVNLPFDKFPRLATFDRVINSLDGRMGNIFSLVQGGGWTQRVDKLTGGWLNKTIVETSGKFISKIGNQATGEFLKNSVGILAKEGFNNGLKTILGGVLKGGVQTAAGATATGVAAGAASGPVGWAVLAGTMLLKGIKKGLEKLGIDFNKVKDSLSITGNKVIDFLIGTVGFLVALPTMIGGLGIAVAAPVIIAVFVGLFGYQMMQNNLISSIVPPVEQPLMSEDETATGSGGVSGGSCAGGVLNISNIYEPIDVSKIKTKLSKSEYKYKNNGDIDFSCINGLLPQKGTKQRSDIIKAAYALLGVPYFMTGGHGTIANGVSSKWGNKITATCSYGNCGRKYLGLDCSGFVRWVYKYVTGEVVGNRAKDIYSKSQKINKSELLPGDIGFISGDHIGIFLGKGINGKYYFIHSAGRSSGVGPQGLGGVYISAYNFKAFGRIKVSLN